MGSLPQVSISVPFKTESFEFFQRPDGEERIVATSLARVAGVSKSTIRDHLGKIPDRYKGVDIVDTLGGKQRKTTVCRSGALQVLARVDTDQGRELLAFLADFFVNWRESRGASVPDELVHEIRALRQEVADLREVQSRPFKTLIHNTRKFGKEELHYLTFEECARLQREGFLTASAFLLWSTGKKQPGPKSAGLTMRTQSYCRRKKYPVRRYLKSGRVHTFLPKEALQLVHDGQKSGQGLLPQGPP